MSACTIPDPPWDVPIREGLKNLVNTFEPTEWIISERAWNTIVYEFQAEFGFNPYDGQDNPPLKLMGLPVTIKPKAKEDITNLIGVLQNVV